MNNCRGTRSVGSMMKSLIMPSQKPLSSNAVGDEATCQSWAAGQRVTFWRWGRKVGAGGHITHPRNTPQPREP